MDDLSYDENLDTSPEVLCALLRRRDRAAALAGSREDLDSLASVSA